MQSQSGNLIQLGMTLLLTITCITCFTFTYASGSKAESGAGLLGAGRCASLCQVAPSQGCIQCWEVFLQLNLCNWLHWAAKYGWGVKVGVDTIKVGRVQLWERNEGGGSTLMMEYTKCSWNKEKRESVFRGSKSRIEV